MPLGEINYLAVAIAAISSIVVGSLWYGPLFGSAWIKLSKFTKKDIQAAKKKDMSTQYSIQFLASMVMAYVLALAIYTVAGVTIMPEYLVGILTSSVLWSGLVATTMLSNVLWGNKPLKLYLIDSSHYLVMMVVMGLILGAWM